MVAGPGPADTLGLEQISIMQQMPHLTVTDTDARPSPVMGTTPDPEDPPPSELILEIVRAAGARGLSPQDTLKYLLIASGGSHRSAGVSVHLRRAPHVPPPEVISDMLAPPTPPVVPVLPSALPPVPLAPVIRRHAETVMTGIRRPRRQVNRIWSFQEIRIFIAALLSERVLDLCPPRFSDPSDLRIPTTVMQDMIIRLMQEEGERQRIELPPRNGNMIKNAVRNHYHALNEGRCKQYRRLWETVLGPLKSIYRVCGLAKTDPGAVGSDELERTRRHASALRLWVLSLTRKTVDTASFVLNLAS
eukprot:gnl/Dysnectes_brevis/4152_a5471_632.p1 GENE.gnl/Dysnectes_brevis/4152_a5471_632~~gnl/Dysnectes_brevis/4152_a5471_632.p1  ORF type:complete len:304 (-),score=60.66 gnl/Dysnectes_brevis/4152_a5471_632:122-1033(-)